MRFSVTWWFRVACLPLVVSLFPLLPLSPGPAGAQSTAPADAREPGSSVLVLEGRVVDGTGGPPLDPGVVVVEGNRIRCVGAPGDCPVPAGARTLDVGDGTVLPGLVDLHVHARPGYVDWFPRAGVTSIRDATNSFALVELMEEMEDRPRIFASGPLLDGPESVLAGMAEGRSPREGELTDAFVLLVESPADSRAAVDSLARRGTSVVKLYETLPPEAFRAALGRAAEAGLPTMADLGLMLTRGLTLAEVDAAEASRWGVGSVEHASGFALAYRRAGGDPTAAGERIDEDLVAGLVEEFRAGGSVLVPTVVTQEQFAADEPAWEDMLLADRVDPVMLREWRGRFGFVEGEAKRLARADLALTRAVVRKALEAGVPVAAGTDAPNPFVVPGGSLHRELEILVELGMTPLEAIHAATGRAALVLGSEEIGVIAPGRLADLLVVEGDPTLDISATQRIRLVIVDGEPLEGEPREDRPRDGEQGGDLCA